MIKITEPNPFFPDARNKPKSSGPGIGQDPLVEDVPKFCIKERTLALVLLIEDAMIGQLVAAKMQLKGVDVWKEECKEEASHCTTASKGIGSCEPPLPDTEIPVGKKAQVIKIELINSEVDPYIRCSCDEDCTAEKPSSGGIYGGGGPGLNSNKGIGEMFSSMSNEDMSAYLDFIKRWCDGEGTGVQLTFSMICVVEKRSHRNCPPKTNFNQCNLCYVTWYGNFTDEEKDGLGAQLGGINRQGTAEWTTDSLFGTIPGLDGAEIDVGALCDGVGLGSNCLDSDGDGQIDAGKEGKVAECIQEMMDSLGIGFIGSLANGGEKAIEDFTSCLCSE